MKNITSFTLLSFIISTLVAAQGDEVQYKKQDLIGKWQLEEILAGETLKLCEDGENLILTFDETNMTFFEIDMDSGCQNGITNTFTYKLESNTISILDGQVDFKIINLTENRLTLQSLDESEVYIRVE